MAAEGDGSLQRSIRRWMETASCSGEIETSKTIDPPVIGILFSRGVLKVVRGVLKSKFFLDVDLTSVRGVGAVLPKLFRRSSDPKMLFVGLRLYDLLTGLVPNPAECPGRGRILHTKPLGCCRCRSWLWPRGRGADFSYSKALRSSM